MPGAAEPATAPGALDLIEVNSAASCIVDNCLPWLWPLVCRSHVDGPAPLMLDADRTNRG